MDYKYPTPQLLLKAICNAIRSKTGNSDEIPHQNIPDELDKLMTEEGYKEKIQETINTIEGTSFINDRITTVKEKLFYGCTSLTTVNLPKCTSIGNNAFYYCTSLTTVNLSKCTSIGGQAFRECHSLSTLILSNNQVTSIPSDAFINSSRIPIIYVPDNLVYSYKIAHNNWRNFIKPLSELPDNLKEEYGYD